MLQCLSSGNLRLCLCSFLLCISTSEVVGGSAFSYYFFGGGGGVFIPLSSEQESKSRSLFSSSLYQCGLWDLFLMMLQKRCSNGKVGILPSSGCAGQCEGLLK